MKYTRLALIIGLLGLALPLAAQDTAMLSLQTASSALQTGQEYEIAIRLDNVTEAWLASVEISYDPNLVYVIGTKAGSPVRQGEFFAPASSVVVANAVQGDRLLYTVSLLPPAQLAQRGGVVGAFRIYPLAAGTTQLRFRQAELGTITITGEGANRVATDPRSVPVSPVLLELTITGERVEPPPEATATPTPTETPIRGAAGAGAPTREPTLANVTAAPQTPEAPATLVAPTDTGGSSSLLLPVAIFVMVVGGVGLLLVLAMWRRSRRR